MQPPQRKTKKTNPKLGRFLAILLALALLLGGGALYLAKRQEIAPYRLSENESTRKDIKSATAREIVLIDVKPKNHPPYVLLNQEGTLWLENAAEPIDAYMASVVLDCFTPLYVEETLMDRAEDYAAHLEDFGLQHPILTLNVTYSDGQVLTLLIGDQAPQSVRRYFLVSGDEHLYLCPNTLYDAFDFDYRLFFTVEQPNISPTRVDRVTVQNHLDASVFEFQPATGFASQANDPIETVQNSFYLTKPVSYPADSEWIAPILTALSNFVLGPKQAPDTLENRALYGLSTPEYTLEVHQKGGVDTVLNSTGQVLREPKAESTYVFEIGAKRDDVTRYMSTNGWIHVINGFQLSFVYDLDPLSTLTKRPLGVPIDLVKALKVDEDAYRLTRIQRLTEQGETETDEQGNPLYDTTVTKNDQTFDSGDFEARFEALGTISVSGKLPQDFLPSGGVIKTLRLVLNTGETREITLIPFDAMHDAVGIDGVYLFYLIKGGLTF